MKGQSDQKMKTVNRDNMLKYKTSFENFRKGKASDIYNSYEYVSEKKTETSSPQSKVPSPLKWLPFFAPIQDCSLVLHWRRTIAGDASTPCSTPVGISVPCTRYRVAVSSCVFDVISDWCTKCKYWVSTTKPCSLGVSCFERHPILFKFQRASLLEEAHCLYGIFPILEPDCHLGVAAMIDGDALVLVYKEPWSRKQKQKCKGQSILMFISLDNYW